VREERIDTDGVPAKLYDPGDARGLLLFGHGGEHSKDSERCVRLCRRFADDTGLAVVCIDAVDHGERKPKGMKAGLPTRWHSTATEQMVTDWQRTTEGLASIGPALAYVGFSMGMIFGAPTVASMATIKAAVFVVGGIPTGAWIDDPPLHSRLLAAAAKLEHSQVLMVNMTQDQLFRAEDAHLFFDAIPGQAKRLMFWASDHDTWPDETIGHSVDFINKHTQSRP
jgi:pimeloyl-ACP methyl ester carboxylesterase